MYETWQGRLRGTARAAAGTGAWARTRQWQGRRTGEGQGRAMLGRGRAVAWQGAFGVPFFGFLSLLKRAPLVLAKKRSGITYVTYMVVTPLQQTIIMVERVCIVLRALKDRKKRRVAVWG